MNPLTSEAPVCAWLQDRGPDWCEQIAYGTLDLSGPYRSVFDTYADVGISVAMPR